MRLVTPARLNRLLLQADTRRSLSKVRKTLSALLQKLLPALRAVFGKLRDIITSAYGKTSAYIKALLPRVRRVLRRFKRKLKLLFNGGRSTQKSVKPHVKAAAVSKPGSPKRAPQNTASVIRPLSKHDIRPESAKKPPANRNVPVRNTKKPSVRKDESFTQSHLRSIVAMSMLALTLLVFVMWGFVSGPGKRTFASMGFGTAQGYILLGDDYMESGNYSRAVEEYYRALNKSVSYTAAYRLAWAYSYTGDFNKTVSALLYCVDNFPSHKESYVQLKALYPDADTRPVHIQKAILAGEELFGI